MRQSTSPRRLRGPTDGSATTVWAPRLTVDLLAGLYNFVTTLDTNGLNAVLPKNRDLTMQNVVGVQMLGWGLGLLFAPEWLTSNIMGGKVGPGVEINQCVGCTR